MKFRTEIRIPKFPFEICHKHRILLMGSCFSDHIGQSFIDADFETFSNPFGILFNPASIEMALKLTLNPKSFAEDFVFYFNDLWVSFAHHGKFSHPNKNFFISQIEKQLEQTHRFLVSTDFLFITFGTAYCYKYLKNNKIVANCHKIPHYEFEKIRLNVEDIVNMYHTIIQQLKIHNPKLKIIFTISPVRHLGDGFHENQLSKSILHLSIEQLIDNQNIFYFPSYEILQDDLRDYRFYTSDLCHPNEQAITYIKEKVMEAFCSQQTLLLIRENEQKNKRNKHISLKSC
jgi:hypothetical protein